MALFLQFKHSGITAVWLASTRLTYDVRCIWDDAFVSTCVCMLRTVSFASTTTNTKELIIVTFQKVAGALYISDFENDGSSQKSVYDS